MSGIESGGLLDEAIVLPLDICYTKNIVLQVPKKINDPSLFDVSVFRFLSVFKILTKGTNNVFNSKQFNEFLNSVTTIKFEKDNLDFMKEIGIEEFDFPLFCKVMRILYLEQLLHPKINENFSVPNYNFTVCDYGASFKNEFIVSNNECRDFMLNSRLPQNENVNVRWISMKRRKINNNNNIDDDIGFRLNMTRLAVKYKINARVLEHVCEKRLDVGEVLSIPYSLNNITRSVEVTNKDGSKKTNDQIFSGDHLFFVIPLFKLSQKSIDSLNTYMQVFQGTVFQVNSSSRRKNHHQLHQNTKGGSEAARRDIVLMERNKKMNESEAQSYLLTSNTDTFSSNNDDDDDSDSSGEETGKKEFEEKRKSVPEKKQHDRVAKRYEDGIRRLFPYHTAYKTCFSRCKGQSRSSYNRLLEGSKIGEKLFDHMDLTTEIEKCELALIIGQRPNNDLVISVTSPWRNKQCEINQVTSFIVSIGSSKDKLNEALSQVPISLEKEYGNLRCSKSPWLSCCLVGSAISTMEPIIDIYKSQLNIAKFRLHVLEDQWPEKESKIIVLMKRELDLFYNETEPLVVVIQELINIAENSTEKTSEEEDNDLLLEEKEDLYEVVQRWKYLGQQVDDIRRKITMLSGGCEGLINELSDYQSAKENGTLYSIALLSVLIVPSTCVFAYFSRNIMSPDEVGELHPQPTFFMENENAIYWIMLFSFVLTILTVWSGLWLG